MKVDGGIMTRAEVAEVVTAVRAAEADGYDGIWSPETAHDPFLPLVLAAEHTRTLTLGTGIAVAFARSPMTVANTAYDLNRLSGGRFLLGLGSQIQPHIERRFSMPWGRPVARMRDFVRALHAIWDSWESGQPLDYHGEFYSHTLMTPFFNPGPSPAGRPPVLLAAVNEGMTEIAGEVCDGLVVHAFSTPRFVREVTVPALLRGLDRAGRRRADVQVSCPAFVVTGADGDETAASEAAVRAQIAFYASTPAYRAVLDLHGWGDLQPELRALSLRGEWQEMGRRLPEEVLHTFAVVAAPDRVAEELLARYGDLVDRLTVSIPTADADLRRSVFAGLRGALPIPTA